MNFKHTFYVLFLLLNGLSLNGQISKDNAIQYRKQISDANEWFKQKEYEKAREEYTKVLVKEPSLIKAEYNLGCTYYALKKFDQAIIHFKKAIKLADEKEVKSMAYHNLGNAYYKEKNFEQATEAYKNSLRLKPSDDKTRYNLAMAQHMLNKKSDSNDPPDSPKPTDFAKLQKQKADALADIGEFKKALKLMQSAIKKDSTVLHFQNYIAKLQEIAALDTIN